MTLLSLLLLLFILLDPAPVVRATPLYGKQIGGLAVIIILLIILVVLVVVSISLAIRL